MKVQDLLKLLVEAPCDAEVNVEWPHAGVMEHAPLNGADFDRTANCTLRHGRGVD